MSSFICFICITCIRWWGASGPFHPCFVWGAGTRTKSRYIVCKNVHEATIFIFYTSSHPSPVLIKSFVLIFYLHSMEKPRFVCLFLCLFVFFPEHRDTLCTTSVNKPFYGFNIPCFMKQKSLGQLFICLCCWFMMTFSVISALYTNFIPRFCYNSTVTFCFGHLNYLCKVKPFWNSNI